MFWGIGPCSTGASQGQRQQHGELQQMQGTGLLQVLVACKAAEGLAYRAEHHGTLQDALSGRWVLLTAIYELVGRLAEQMGQDPACSVPCQTQASSLLGACCRASPRTCWLRVLVSGRAGPSCACASLACKLGAICMKPTASAGAGKIQ